uniref:Uncharacterized protein n=1 Tax=Eutreptiella gymnastica TaxID=73025 RepID=A0A7S4CY25_9EUGL
MHLTGLEAGGRHSKSSDWRSGGYQTVGELLRADNSGCNAAECHFGGLQAKASLSIMLQTARPHPSCCAAEPSVRSPNAPRRSRGHGDSRLPDHSAPAAWHRSPFLLAAVQR